MSGLTQIPVERALELTVAAAALAGIDSAAAVPVRLGESTGFRLPGGVVAAVHAPDHVEPARLQVSASRWLADVGVPAVTLHQGFESPVLVEGHAVIFWEALPEHRNGSYSEIAGALRRLHGLRRPQDPALRPVDPFRRTADRLLSSALLEPGARHALLRRVEALRAAYDELPPGLPYAPLHGDAWPGNIVTLADGTVVLRDLERLSFGPPEWDLVSCAVDFTTFGEMTAAQYAGYSEAYGYDVVAWEGFAVLRDIRELRVVAFALTAAEYAPDLLDQARHRVQDCLAGERPWPGWRQLQTAGRLVEH